MQVVIEIDDELYEDIKKDKIYFRFPDIPLKAVNAIATGIPLSKGQGSVELSRKEV